MKIALVTDTYMPQINGVSYTVQLWKNALKKAGHKPYVFYPEDPSYEPQDDEVPVMSIEFPFYYKYRFAIANPFSIASKMKDFDIIHVHAMLPLAVPALWAAFVNKKPAIFTFHTPVDMYVEYLTSNPGLQSLLFKLYDAYKCVLFNSVKLVTAPSEIMAKKLDCEKAIKLSNGIDTDFFNRADDGEIKKFKKKYGIPAGSVIGYTGRHSYEKHLEDLIAMADDFQGTIVLAGGGPANEYYRDLAKDKKNVLFLGFLPREELCALYSALDVFVIPSTAETQGLVVLEANACGVPAVGADALALKETVHEGKNGYRYQPGDSKELMEMVKKAYKNKNKLSKNALEFAQSQSITNTVRKLEGIYESMLVP